jgi:hypothetical protein
MGSPSKDRRVVTVGWDAHSHPIRRYHDELELADHLRARPRLPDPTRRRCFAPACREAEERAFPSGVSHGE